MFHIRFHFQKVILVALALMVVISGLGLAAQPAQAGACLKYHTVQRGEYLSLIAKMYGTDWRTLAELNNLSNPSRIYAGNVLCVQEAGTTLPNTGTTNGGKSPAVDILKVRKGDDVTIKAYNFPANSDVDVRMDKMGTTGERGIFIVTLETDRNGVLEETIDFPNELRNETQIVIRLEGERNTFSYNWFYNRDFSSTGGTRIVPNLNDENAFVTSKWVDRGKRADLYAINAGVFMPNARVSATYELLRHKPNESVLQNGLNFTQDLLEVRLFDERNKQIAGKVAGLNYVYFNMNADERDAYNRGKLGIYEYNSAKRTWEPCEIQILVKTENKPHGRIACVVSEFGLFAVASK